MKFNRKNTDLTEGKVILNKGLAPGGHFFEIYVKDAIIYATIFHADEPEISETFEINRSKYTILEHAVDARIKELLWV